MPVAAQPSIISFAPQTAKLGDGAFTVSSYNWRQFRAPSITGGTMQGQGVLPPETGGPMTPSGAYKTGASGALEADIIVRLKGEIGYLLEAALGNVSSVADSKYTASGWQSNTAGTYGHLFRFSPSGQADVPWLAVRKFVPGLTSSENFGEGFYDAKLSTLRLNIPASNIMTARVGFQGRIPFFPSATDVNNWTYANTLEGGSGSLAHTGQAGSGVGLRIGSTIPKIEALTVDITNTILTPQIVGTPYPDDVVVVSRAVTMQASVLWENPTLWRKIYGGGASGTSWNIKPYIEETLSNVRAFAFEAVSPDYITGSTPYVLRVMADNVVMQMDPTSMRLVPGDLIRFNVGIQVLQPENPAHDYIILSLDNAVSSYSWE
jgi:hypothetical protein